MKPRTSFLALPSQRVRCSADLCEIHREEEFVPTEDETQEGYRGQTLADEGRTVETIFRRRVNTVVAVIASIFFRVTLVVSEGLGGGRLTSRRHAQ